MRGRFDSAGAGKENERLRDAKPVSKTVLKPGANPLPCRARFDIQRVHPSMRVSKWGNSLAVRLPKAVVDELGLTAGDRLEIVSATRKRLAVATEESRQRAIERMRARALPIPADFTIDRDEANAR